MRTTPTNAVEALICLPPLESVVQSEARSAAHRLWSLGGWSYLHPSWGHSSILMWLQQPDPIFNMGADVIRPAFNFEPKYRVTTLTREEWTKGTGIPPAIKGLDWFTDGSKMKDWTGPGVYGQSVGRRFSFSLGRYATVFQVEIYAFWHVFMKFNFRVDQRSMRVSALIVRRFWKFFRPSEQHLHWANGAKSRWMISLPGTWWGCIVSLDMLGYEVMRLLTNLQGTALFWGLLDLTRPWESLGRIYKKGLDVGWLTSIGYGGNVLVTPKDRLKS